MMGHYTLQYPELNQTLLEQSWVEIPAEMVRKSFKTCDISNALEGTKNDAVYADDMPKLADGDMAMEDQFETDSEEANE